MPKKIRGQKKIKLTFREDIGSVGFDAVLNKRFKEYKIENKIEEIGSVLTKFKNLRKCKREGMKNMD